MRKFRDYSDEELDKINLDEYEDFEIFPTQVPDIMEDVRAWMKKKPVTVIENESEEEAAKRLERLKKYWVLEHQVPKKPKKKATRKKKSEKPSEE